MKRYGQFCPVAKAAEILAERWTLLILRELLLGSHRYNDLQRGVPRISPTVLTQRLKELQEHGIVQRDIAEDGRSHLYSLTASGQELWPLIELAGTWGQRWVRSKMTRDELDAGLLMWDIRRNIQISKLPKARTVVYFEFSDAKKGLKRWWLVVESGAVDLCLDDPGYDIDIVMVTDLATMTRIWMGDLSLEAARSSRLIELKGSSLLCRTVRDWLGPSPFAHVKAGVITDAPVGARRQQRDQDTKRPEFSRSHS